MAFFITKRPSRELASGVVFYFFHSFQENYETMQLHVSKLGCFDCTFCAKETKDPFFDVLLKILGVIDFLRQKRTLSIHLILLEMSELKANKLIHLELHLDISCRVWRDGCIILVQIYHRDLQCTQKFKCQICTGRCTKTMNIRGQM